MGRLERCLAENDTIAIGNDAHENSLDPRPRTHERCTIERLEFGPPTAVHNAGHHLVAGQLGENITTTGIDLISLPVGSMLRIGNETLVALTGLRNPCRQIKSVGDGVMKMMFIDDPDNPDGPKIGRTGVMGIVVAGGTISADDAVKVRFPAGPLSRMEKV